MAKRIVAVVGSYRKGGMIDSAVEQILDGARQKGAETHTIYLLDQNIEFCTNCRSCTQEAGLVRGKCVHQDDMAAILHEMEAADALVFGSPVNFFNTTALFRRFLERMAVYAYWPWGKASPSPRNKLQGKKAILVLSSAMPGPLIRFATGAPKALKLAAQMVGARTVGKFYIGLSSLEAKPRLSARQAATARKLGAKLA